MKIWEKGQKRIGKYKLNRRKPKRSKKEFFFFENAREATTLKLYYIGMV